MSSGTSVQSLVVGCQLPVQFLTILTQRASPALLCPILASSTQDDSPPAAALRRSISMGAGLAPPNGSQPGTPSASRPNSGRGGSAPQRPVPALVDAVRSRDETKLAEVLEALRTAQGHVMGECRPEDEGMMPQEAAQELLRQLAERACSNALSFKRLARGRWGGTNDDGDANVLRGSAYMCRLGNGNGVGWADRRRPAAEDLECDYIVCPAPLWPCLPLMMSCF